MKKIWFFFLLPLFLSINIVLFFTGCSSILSKTIYSTQIKSTPEHVNYEIKNKKGTIIEKGTTPAITDLKAGDFFSKGSYTIEFSKSNYEPNITKVDYKIDPTFWLNIFFYGFTMPIDAATGAMWKPVRPNYYITLSETANSPVLTKSVDKGNNAVNESGLMVTSDVEGKYYALIIGNNVYEDPNLMDLDKPIEDATSLYEVLIRTYTFDKENVIFLKNATRRDIIRECDYLSKTLTQNDNLLIFYAGHGYWDENKQQGYWLPVDAERDLTADWIRNSTIQGYVESIDSKHTLLIADACFGGGIFKTRSAFDDASKSIKNLYRYQSRKAMTSGMLNEVPDKSVFMESLVRHLENNEVKFLPSMDLFMQFRESVMNNSFNAPQFGTIHNTGDQGGDFIFIKKD